MDVVEVDHAVRGKTILDRRQRQLRNKLTPGSRKRGHHDGLNPVGDGIAG
jgi:hypothetical protein